jgi:hypothetical protein
MSETLLKVLSVPNVVAIEFPNKACECCRRNMFQQEIKIVLHEVDVVGEGNEVRIRESSVVTTALRLPVMNQRSFWVEQNAIRQLPQTNAEIGFFAKGIPHEGFVKASNLKDKISSKRHISTRSRLDLSETPILVKANIAPVKGGCIISRVKLFYLTVRGKKPSRYAAYRRIRIVSCMGVKEFGQWLDVIVQVENDVAFGLLGSPITGLCEAGSWELNYARWGGQVSKKDFRFLFMGRGLVNNQ